MTATRPPSPPLRLAVWSGPRNLSSALMRSFAQLPGCRAMDEPLYAAYLARTGIDHPMRAAIIAAGEPDIDRAVAACLAPCPGAAIIYQKHMTHHIPDGLDLDWIEGLANMFLIRAPERVVASYARKRETPALAEIGFFQQAALFERASGALGRPCPVIDAEDLRADPERALRALCAAVGLEFSPAMLSWAPGRRDYDGVWAAHWYDALDGSTGFAPPGGALPALTGAAAAVADAARPAYETLARHKL